MSDIEADEEYDVDEDKGSITRRYRVLYHVKWLGYPKKKEWTFEPYKISRRVDTKSYINSTSTTQTSRRTAA